MTCYECEHPDIRSSQKPACNDGRRDYGRIKTCPTVHTNRELNKINT